MPENNKIKSDEICAIARGQAVVEARQMLDGDCRVLSAAAVADVRPSEVFAGEARYAGKVKFDCLLLCEDGIRAVGAVADFSDKITSSAISSGLNPFIAAEIANVEATIDGGTLKLVAVVDTNLTAAVHCDCECLSEPEQGIYVERRSIGYCTVVAEQSETLYLTDSVSNVKLGDKIEILCATSRAVITSAECGVDDVKLTGAVYTAVVARGADGLACSFKQVTPIVKSVSVPGALPDAIAYADVCVTETVATSVSDPEGDRIDLALTLRADITVAVPNKTDVVCDVFCADNELETTASEVRVCLPEPQITVTDTVDGQISLDPSKLAADNVLCIEGAFCQIGSAKIESGRVNVEGLVGGDIVYYNAENNKTDSISFRLPFSMPLAVHTEAKSVSLCATVTDVTVKIRRESVFDVKAEVAFTARLYSCDTVSLVQSVKRGEAIARPDATFIVHIAKPGETLWQAAKALCCSPDRVLEQNDISAPYSGGEKLINFCTRES